MATMLELMDEEHTFHAAVGQCITAWASIEQKLFALFKSALGAEADLCSSLFWTFPTFKMRLSYTSLIIEQTMNDSSSPSSKQHPCDAQKAWRQLNKKIADMYSFRNNVAHQPIPETVSYFNSDGGVTVVVATVNQIFPNPYDGKKRFDPIKLNDLLDHYNQVEILKVNIDLFTTDYRNARPSRCFRTTSTP